jgi:hypothetical protein
MFRKLFPPSCEMKGTPILLGPLERTDLNHWSQVISLHRTQQSTCLPPVVVPSYLEFHTMDRFQEPSGSIICTILRTLQILLHAVFFFNALT